MTDIAVVSSVEGIPIAALIYRLEAAANTIHTVPLNERRDLIEQGVSAIDALRADLESAGNVSPLQPRWMADMRSLAEISSREDAVEVLVAAGMSLIAAELERLRGLRVLSSGR